MPPPPQVADSGRPRSQARCRVWGRRSASWTPDEDAKLVELVKKESAVPPSITASKTWSRVAAQLTNRTGKQCRERYLNQLKPGIRRDPWSQEEERILHEAHAQIGNKWVSIANLLPGRTDNCVKNHWNSMLRKRQRREAALKAAEAEVVATLGRSHKSATDVDGKSEADYSVHTGCATPSGASSSYQDVPTSGIPSPFTASSPITPKRDSKLQISSLVAASTKELPSWNVPYPSPESDRIPITFDSKTNSIPRNSSFDTVPRAQDANRNGFAFSPNPQQFVQSASVALRAADAFDDQLVVRSLRLKEEPTKAPRLPAISHTVREVLPDDVSPMRCIASSSRLPVLMQGIRTEVKSKCSGIDRQVRRSSRLVTSSRGAQGSTDVRGLVGVQKKRSGKARGIGGGVNNPLAALAAAASSVPPSPLTPESRFSNTSRSRSVSPVPRLWTMQCKAGNGSQGDQADMRHVSMTSPSMVHFGSISGVHRNEGTQEFIDSSHDVATERP